MGKVLLVSVLVFASVLAASAQSVCPELDFVSRSAWLARTPSLPLPLLSIRPAPFVIVHATYTLPCATPDVCARITREIQTFQMEANNWQDISYHFLVGGEVTNRVYSARGWAREGVNVGDYNNQAINIGFIGSYHLEQPSAQTTELLDNFIECGIRQGLLAQNVRVIAQCQVVDFIDCDGTTILDWVSENPRFEANPQPQEIA